MNRFVRALIPKPNTDSNKPLFYIQLEHYLTEGFIYNFPGGKVKEHETAFEAMCREVKEECGIDVISAFQISNYNAHDLGTDWTGYVFYVVSYKGEPTPKETTIVKAEWKPLEEFVSKKYYRWFNAAFKSMNMQYNKECSNE